MEQLPFDPDNFRELLKEYLVELQECGSEVLPTDRTLDFFVAQAQRFIDEGDGVVIIWPCGFAFGGSFGPSPVDTTFSNPAYALGVYVGKDHRKQGHGLELKMELRRQLYRKGFDVMLAPIHVMNRASLDSLNSEPGVYAHQYVFVVQLGGEE